MGHILAIDQGTTSSRAIIFDADMAVVATGQEEFAQHFPRSGWVEHDPADLWGTVLRSCRQSIETAGISASDIAGIGITNQRETTLVWDRKTGAPVYNAIVWQDRRTADHCRTLREAGHEPMIRGRTGLLLDPYFSGTKLAWILDHVDGARARAEAGELVFGTVDSWLIWQLTDGRVHATDATNAARTMLYNIVDGQWDSEICALLSIPMGMLPEVRDCADDFGVTAGDILDAELPILGVAGDQQAATIGQACFEPGMMKSTYGTGCFALLNTGGTLVQSQNKLLGTIAYRLDGATTYALEGSIFVAGAVVQWLRDGLRIIDEASETAALAAAADPEQEVIMVPAFTGLGAPYWDAECRGAVFGLTRGTGREELAKAALESVGFQTLDLLRAMRADWPEGAGETVLRVDGGMVNSDWSMQFLSDILAAPVDRPSVVETTALGAAWLAGMRAGIYRDKQEFAASWALQRRFEPEMPEDVRTRRYAAWQDAVRRTLT
ncbi:glycerol kinase GlpK [Alisedimentitalea sp. MJ-SS2]|uniref:glycerol kinase GlpK n=1 Tax=Aliisedimentitalea sp. MJ-SS2 TaxID=3049795 RepID=UPI0029155E57|nr:glycerol kinase GlpK [Alisedimentitalea sp. MJ-SS2]MDU8929532.1 glycerol kinase GlpK [Alisedimentitalea sp. MJ-SS2]